MDNTNLQRGQGPDEFLYGMGTAENHLYDMGGRLPTVTPATCSSPLFLRITN